MKAKRNVLPIMLMALSLASCGGPSSSSASASSSGEPSSSAPISSSTSISSEPLVSSVSSSQEAPQWDKDTLALFNAHLYGVELPFIDFCAYQAEYDDMYDEIFISGEGVEEGDIPAYAGFFELDGWIGGDISESNGFEEGTAFSFTKLVQTEAGDRFVYCVFYALDYDEDAESYVIAKQGSLHLEAYDPYYYEWPAEAAEYLAEGVYNFDLVAEATPAPAFPNAHHYSVSTRDGAIYCFADSDGSEDLGYGKILEDAGWTIQKERDNFGYFVAVSPNLDYQVAYLYDEDYGDLDIYFESYKLPLVAYDSWQSEIIDGFFAKYDTVGYAYEIPAIEVEGGEYYFYEDEDNFYNYIFDEYEAVVAYAVVNNASSSDYSAYLTKLENAGWAIDNGALSVLLEKEFENRLAHMELVFDAEEGSIYLKFGLIPSVNPYKGWPSEAIEEELAYLLETDEFVSLPAYTGAQNGITLNGNVIDIYVDAGEGAALIETYIGLLLDAGFTLDEDHGYYLDPTGTYFVSIYDIGDCVEIYLDKPDAPIPTFEAWPAEEIAAVMGALQNPIPALEGADYYELSITSFDNGDAFGSVSCVFSDASALQSKLSAYNDALVSSGFTVYDEVSAGTRYCSPKEEYVINAEAMDYEDYGVITVYFDNLIDGQL